MSVAARYERRCAPNQYDRQAGFSPKLRAPDRLDARFGAAWARFAQQFITLPPSEENESWQLWQRRACQFLNESAIDAAEMGL